MASSLAEYLKATRHKRFVGRTSELTLFQAALTAPSLRFHVLHIFGPGGVGKTTLLQEYIRLCQEHQINCLYFDARNIEPTADALLTALGSALDLAIPQTSLENLASYPQRQVLLIDTYETLIPLDGWLRDSFLPQLTDQTLIVLAGRQPPLPPWRMDSGWQSLVYSLSLRNLNPQESRAYLTQRQIPPAQQQPVLEFTHGHPLALSLVADMLQQRPGYVFQLAAMPDVVKVLLERFVQDLPSPLHREMLEACALVRVTTESLLAAMLDLPATAELAVHDLFEWLRHLSFMEAGWLGLFPHDLARDVLIADLRWRNPDRYADLHQRARAYYTRRLGQTQGQEQHRILFDYIFLHRDNPAVRPRFIWQDSKHLTTTVMQAGDEPILINMVRRHEGEASAHLAAHWLAQQPHSVLVFRDGTQAITGFVMTLALHQASPADMALDPAAQAAWSYLEHHAPLRAGEGAALFRLWMAQDTYQAVSLTQSLIFITFVQYHRNTPKLAFTFFPCADPDDWAAMFAYADLVRLPQADFAVGDRTYGVYGHDWRVISPAAWQELLAQREIAASAQVIAPTAGADPQVVLSQPDFTAAVRQALRDFTRVDALQTNPLRRSRLVIEQDMPSQAPDAIAALQHHIRTAAESLQASPREAKYYQALYHTYLHPTPTQEQAAELLDLPFSTFRRHLRSGITRVTEILWQLEIG